jgi:hypothetical protein
MSLLATHRQATRRSHGRVFIFVAAGEPLAAAEAVWAAREPVDLCVFAPSTAARETAAFACAGRAVQMDVEPLLGAPHVDETETELALREVDALRTLYALDARCAFVVWDTLAPLAAVLPAGATAVTLDEAWLLETADRIERSLPLP